MAFGDILISSFEWIITIISCVSILTILIIGVCAIPYLWRTSEEFRQFTVLIFIIAALTILISTLRLIL